MYARVREGIVLSFQGIKFMVPKETECFWPYYGICFVGEYDPLLKDIKTSDIVVDAGANIGIFTLLAAKKAKMIIAVEPDPENFEYLEKNVKLNNAKNVILINKAISNYVGDGFISGRGLSAALSHKGIPVKVTTIDEMIRELGLVSFDVLKIDIEGAESKALSGNFLSNIRELMVECHGDENCRVIRSKLEAEGFTVKEWSFSSLKVLKRILVNLRSFINAELRTSFSTTISVLEYVLGLRSHPVPAAAHDSNIKLFYAMRI